MQRAIIERHLSCLYKLKCDGCNAETLVKCVHEVGTLIVSVVDTKGALSKALLRALEGFVTSLSSAPDMMQLSR